MRAKYIADFIPDDTISEVFLIENRNLLTTKTGKPYINLTLRDKTGQIQAKVWDDAEAIYEQLGSSEFAEVSGTVGMYQNNLQLRVGAIRTLKSDKIDISEFLGESKRDTVEMLNEVKAICSTISDEFLKKLTGSFLNNPEYSENLKKAPGAKTIHHAYLGGLLEHTLSVMQVCNKLSSHYNLNRDLLIAGALFHDIGKLEELSAGKAFDYTREGFLIGHVVIGFNMVEREMDKIDGFPPKLRTELGHMILSHQGILEYGAPVKPMFAEAVMLHYVDDLDVKVNLFKNAAIEDKNESSDFTGYLWKIENRVYKGLKNEEDV